MSCGNQLRPGGRCPQGSCSAPGASGFAASARTGRSSWIAVGVDDTSIKRAINLLIQNKGGISLVSDSDHIVLPLPVGGLMSGQNGYDVAQRYERIDEAARSLGCTLAAPYMSLSFLALLVIPELKLSDKGLFDGKDFKFVNLFS